MSNQWVLKGRFERKDGPKKTDRTVVDLDFKVDDATMKSVMALLSKTGGKVKAKSKSVDLRSVFR